MAILAEESPPRLYSHYGEAVAILGWKLIEAGEEDFGADLVRLANGDHQSGPDIPVPAREKPYLLQGAHITSGSRELPWV